MCVCVCVYVCAWVCVEFIKVFTFYVILISYQTRSLFPNFLWEFPKVKQNTIVIVIQFVILISNIFRLCHSYVCGYHCLWWQCPIHFHLDIMRLSAKSGVSFIVIYLNSFSSLKLENRLNKCPDDPWHKSHNFEKYIILHTCSTVLDKAFKTVSRSLNKSSVSQNYIKLLPQPHLVFQLFKNVWNSSLLRWQETIMPTDLQL